MSQTDQVPAIGEFVSGWERTRGKKHGSKKVNKMPLGANKYTEEDKIRVMGQGYFGVCGFEKVT